MTLNSPNIGSSTTTGPWTDFNLLYSEGQWFDMAVEGLPGNLVVRLVVDPLCPARIGDMPAWDGLNEPGWDGDIDNDDRQAFLTAMAAPGDIFDDIRIYMDLNNDGVLDTDDLAILDANMTGSGSIVSCPTIEILTPDIQAEALPGIRPDNGLFQVRNSGAGELNVTVKPSAFWLGANPSQTTSQGEIADIELVFMTEALDPGVYPAWILVEGNGTNAPQVATVTVTIGVPGDFNSDGVVDYQDVEIFQYCADGSGPAIPYDPESLALGCTLTPDAERIIVADFDRDGDVDQVDFGLFQLYLGQPTGMSPHLLVEIGEVLASSAHSHAIEIVDHIPFADTHARASSETGAVHPVRQAPKVDRGTGDGPEDLRLVIGLVLLVILGVLAYLVWGLLDSAAFFGNATNPGSTEIGRIRQAIDLLDGLGHPDSDQAFVFLGQPKYYNADIFGGIRLNRESLDDVSQRATVFKSSKTIVVHESFVNTETWDADAKRILALILFAEWQHIQEPDKNEDECQEWLDQFRQAVGWDDLSLPFHHGTNEAAGN